MSPKRASRDLKETVEALKDMIFQIIWDHDHSHKSGISYKQILHKLSEPSAGGYGFSAKDLEYVGTALNFLFRQGHTKGRIFRDDSQCWRIESMNQITNDFDDEESAESPEEPAKKYASDFWRERLTNLILNSSKPISAEDMVILIATQENNSPNNRYYKRLVQMNLSSIARRPPYGISFNVEKHGVKKYWSAVQDFSIINEEELPEESEEISITPVEQLINDVDEATLDYYV